MIKFFKEKDDSYWKLYRDQRAQLDACKREPDFVDWFCWKLKEIDAVARLTNPLLKIGIPDLHIEHTLFSGFVEFKSEKGALSKEQKFQVASLFASGSNVLIVRYFMDYERHFKIVSEDIFGCGLLELSLIEDVGGETLLQFLKQSIDIWYSEW